GQAAPAHARLIILILLLSWAIRRFTIPKLMPCVIRSFIILILPQRRRIIVDVLRLVVGAMLIALTCLIRLIQIGGKLGRGRKLGCVLVGLGAGFQAEAIIGRRALLVSVGVSNQSREFCDRIAFSVGSGAFANHGICSSSVFAPGAPRTRLINERRANGDY